MSEANTLTENFEDELVADEVSFDEVNEPTPHWARTKIVATIGPACREPHMLAKLVRAGVDVFRLNMAHGKCNQHDQTIRDIRQISKTAKRPIGILVDLAGPKIRLGELQEEPIVCKEGDEFQFIRGTATPNSPTDLTSCYEPLIDELQVGNHVMLADGTVTMVVTGKENDAVQCKVIGPGQIRSRQGINLPGAKLSVPAMSEEDIENAVWASLSGVDFISLSFVRSPVEVRDLKNIVADNGSQALVIAKIEKPEAIESLDDIVQAADGIMVARGDLGVEIDVAQMPVEQKRIVDTCTKFGRPVIVATQMLDSMQHASRPTRAEATDVANAILDGADACMLSGETAVGDFPVESVEMMNRIMLSTEKLINDRWRPAPSPREHNQVCKITSSVVYASGRIANFLDAKLVFVATRTGNTAIAKAKQRDFIPTIAVSDNPAVLRQLTLFWGIDPIESTSGYADQQLVEFINDWGRKNRDLVSGDKIVIVGVTGDHQTAHNSLMVHEIE